MSSTIRSTAAFLLASTVLVTACTAGSAETIGVATSFNVVTYAEEKREAMPDFSGETLREGSVVGDELLAGKVGVINFWGSWCGPCRGEQAELEALWKEYGPRGVVFLGINTRRDQRAAALAYLEEFAVTYPSIYDPPSRIASDFGVRVMPATFVLDTQRRIAAQIIGALRNEADLRALLDAELTG